MGVSRDTAQRNWDLFWDELQDSLKEIFSSFLQNVFFYLFFCCFSFVEHNRQKNCKILKSVHCGDLMCIYFLKGFPSS